MRPLQLVAKIAAPGVTSAATGRAYGRGALLAPMASHLSSNSLHCRRRLRSDHLHSEHLLAARGYGTQRQARAIEQINLAGTFEPLEALQPADVNVRREYDRTWHVFVLTRSLALLIVACASRATCGTNAT